MTWIRQSVAIWLTGLALLAGAARAETDLLAFPARGHIDLAEGTIECWICFPRDPLPAADDAAAPAYHFRGNLLSVTTADAIEPSFLTIGFFAKRGDGQRAPFRLAARIALLGVPPPGHYLLLFPPDIQGGDWHHLAITWDRENYNAYLNGQPSRIAPRDWKQRTERFAARLGAAAQIILGSDPAGVYRGRAPFIIDDFRISSVARPAADLGYHGPLKPDLFTTLLLTFDAPAELPPAMPAYLQPVAGQFGQGLSLGTLEPAVP
ncbi:MAG: LamG domain-containing protein [Candidatus Marinimicrobia bacterium]|nr:LamG domain-containing protein [Candidatus Neomarinimicrobiota bacterium]